MTKFTRLCIAMAGSVLLGASARAEDWAQWRGPHFDGSSAETKLPGKLDPKENLVWSTQLPGPSAGTPAVLGDRIFVPAWDNATKKLLAMAVNRADGKVLWSKAVGEGSTSNKMNDLCSCSPIADGKNVYFYYGTSDLAAFDRDGNPLWARNLEKEEGRFNMLWLYSSSPLLYGGKLYVPVLHRDTPIGQRGGPPAPAGERADSYLLCIDPATGKDLWKQVRPTDAVKESREAYTTPLPLPTPSGTQIVVTGGDYVTGHDAETGKELWRFGTYNQQKIDSWRTVPSACIGGGLVYFSPPKGGNKAKGETFYAVKPGAGDLPAQLLWKSADVTTDVCTPLYYQDQLFVLNGDNPGHVYLACLDPKTGDKKWTTTLTSTKTIRTAPTGADGKIYFMNEAGDVWVVSAVDGKILSKQSLGSDSACRSAIVTAGGQVFVRTADHLYAFGEK